MKLEWKMTIPNMLSIFRILLVPVFAVLYLNSQDDLPLLIASLAVLIVSGLTDLFDGMIARKLNQISELGKILDPLADKLTQITVLICLTIRNPRLIPLMIICLVKETVQLIGGAIMLKHQNRVRPSNWYGKISTAVFYFVMALIFLFPVEENVKPILFDWHMPQWLFITLIVLVIVLMVYSFVRYAMLYFSTRKEWSEKSPEEVSSISETSER